MKDPLNLTKVVLRHLPASLPQQTIMEQIDAKFAERYDWAQFRPGKSGVKNQRHARVYINFKKPEDVVEFAEFFNGRMFVNEKGAQFKALVEYAPSQRIPKSNPKKDGREGTISKDPDYLEFLELISKPSENLPSAEIQLERKEAERAAVGKEALVVTPLMSFIRQKRAAKSGILRTAVSSGSSRGSRKNAPILSGSPSPSKRVSERRRVPSSAYGLREGRQDGSYKEKPKYILASRREEPTAKDKSIAGSSSSRSVSETIENDSSASSRIMTGSSKLEGKIVILKGKARESSQAPDSSVPQQNTTPVKSSPVPASSGRIIKGILTNKDPRPPRAPNMRSIPRDQQLDGGDDKGHFEDKFSGTYPLVNDKMERTNRSRDRPDRGVWAPRRFDYMEGGISISHHGSGHGERKSEINIARREDMRIYSGSGGSGRGGLSSMENGSQRHTSRRGLPRGPKEMESSIPVLEGKHSKRGSAGYGAHERQVWVQKSGSAS